MAQDKAWRSGHKRLSETFRTPDEAVMLANNSRYGLAASIWSENINVAIEMAAKVILNPFGFSED